MSRQGWLFIATLLLFATALATSSCQRESTVPKGLPFSVVKGYQNWPLISISYRQDLRELHIILGNTTALEDFLHGVPDNGYPFTDGAILVRLVYTARAHQAFPRYLAPGMLKGLDYMVKDAQRFKATRGWGYASFTYDEKRKTFKPSSTALPPEKCIKCHQLVQKRDYIFTPYTSRRPR